MNTITFARGILDETGPAERQANRLSLFVVDNQSLYRRAICQALTGKIAIAGESALSGDGWKAVEDASPDIVLVAVDAPAFMGFAVARQISSRCPGVKVVVMSSQGDAEELFEAIKVGAVAFLRKDISAENLVAALRRVGAGECPINESLLTRPDTARKVLQSFRDLSLMGKQIVPLVTPLSPRETQILKHVAEGFTNKRIACTLDVSEQTIKNYLTSILRKLSANDRAHAVVLALRYGLLDAAEVLVASEHGEVMAAS